MNSLLLLAALPSSAELLSLLVWVAIACVVVGGIIALIKWSGVQIPPPVVIIFWCFVAVAMILFIARVFGAIS